MELSKESPLTMPMLLCGSGSYVRGEFEVMEKVTLALPEVASKEYHLF